MKITQMLRSALTTLAVLGFASFVLLTVMSCRRSDADTDKDGLKDAEESLEGTDELDPDTDGDGFNDAAEVKAGSNPKDVNSVPETPPSLLVDLDARSLPEGDLLLWKNLVAGSAIPDFLANNARIEAGAAVPSSAVPGPMPQVVTIGGLKGVDFSDRVHLSSTEPAPAALLGQLPRTIEAWIYNAALGTGGSSPPMKLETVVSWGDWRKEHGMISLNHSSDPFFGAALFGHKTPFLKDMGLDWAGNAEAAKWSCLAFTYDRITARVYLNGKLGSFQAVVLNTLGGGTADPPHILVTAISQYDADKASVFTKKFFSSTLSISRLRIYSGALSAGGVAQSYNAEAANFGRELIPGVAAAVPILPGGMKAAGISLPEAAAPEGEDAAELGSHDGAAETAALFSPAVERSLITLEPQIEFFITKERKLRITLLDLGDELATTANQPLSVMTGNSKEPVTLTFSREGNVLLSQQSLPAGDNSPMAVTYLAGASSGSTDALPPINKWEPAGQTTVEDTK